MFAENHYEGGGLGLALIRDCNGARAFETLLRYRGGTLAELWCALRTLKALQAEGAAPQAVAAPPAEVPAPAQAAIPEPAPRPAIVAPAHTTQPNEPESRANREESEPAPRADEPAPLPGGRTHEPRPVPPSRVHACSAPACQTNPGGARHDAPAAPPRPGPMPQTRPEGEDRRLLRR